MPTTDTTIIDLTEEVADVDTAEQIADVPDPAAPAEPDPPEPDPANHRLRSRSRSRSPRTSYEEIVKKLVDQGLDPFGGPQVEPPPPTYDRPAGPLQAGEVSWFQLVAELSDYD